MKIIAGNWKMNGNKALLQAMDQRLGQIETQNSVILCVPYILLGRSYDNIVIGAQDISEFDNGAYTGQISAKMVFESGAKYTLVGHSECREYRGDTNETVCAKASLAMQNGLIPIICVGETASERSKGKTFDIIEKGIKESIPDINGDIIVAYEPRWAIGQGITPTYQDIESAHSLIYEILKNIGRENTPILYGASVNSKNAKDIMSIAHVDGVLVGGASLKIDEFVSIIDSVK